MEQRNGKKTTRRRGRHGQERGNFNWDVARPPKGNAITLQFRTSPGGAIIVENRAGRNDGEDNGNKRPRRTRTTDRRALAPSSVRKREGNRVQIIARGMEMSY